MVAQRKPSFYLLFLILIIQVPKVLRAQTTPLFLDSRAQQIGIQLNPANIQLKKGGFAATAMFVGANVTSNAGNTSLNDLFRINANFLRENVLGTSKIASGYGSINLVGPSVSYGINSRLTVAIGTGTRFHANFNDADGRLISEIGEITKVHHTYPYQMRNRDMYMTAAIFSQLSVSGAYQVIRSSEHSLSLGVSLALTNGIGQTSIEVSGLTGTIIQNAPKLTSLTNATGAVGTMTSGDIFSRFTFNDLVKLKKVSLSGGTGITYMYKPIGDDNYKVRIGISLIDIGHVRFESDSAYSKSYNVKIAANERLFFNNNFNNSSFSHTTIVYDKHPEFFTKTSTRVGNYNLSLPTSLSAVADLRITKELFIGAQVLASLRKSDNPNSLSGNSGVFLVPRWEKNKVGLAVPLSFQRFARFGAGASVRVGGFFISSNNLFNFAFSKPKQLGLIAGFAFNPFS
jgi:hypothetical protein